MAATTITNTMKNGLRQKIIDMISYGQYKIGSTWYRAEIDSKEIKSNGAVHATFYIQVPASRATPASQFRLCNSSGTVLAERTENVPFVDNLDEILYRFKFGISVA
ncbi:MAG: hypothetical protein IJP78_07895 [Clostridia bacterium]|nr:hypothetical protein [Clostridia bacterium]